MASGAGADADAWRLIGRFSGDGRGVMAIRAFNGLNGGEVRTRILQEIERELVADTRLGAHLTFPVVTWKWTLELAVEPVPGQVGPGVDGTVRVERAGRVEGGPGVVSAGPSGRETALLDPRGRPMMEAPVAAARFRDGVDAAGVGGAAAVPVASAVENRLAKLESLLASLVHGTMPVTGETGTSSPGPEARAATHHPDVQNRTATGLPITGGAAVSPGANLAASFGGGSSVGVVQPAEVPAAQALAYGVVHSSLADGGVGPPDQVRREAGLPVPQMQATSGGLVDLPAGTF